MSRPWYVWCIMAGAALLLLGTVARLFLVWNSILPGVLLEPGTRLVVSVRPGSPLGRAGVRVGDRLERTPELDFSGPLRRRLRPLRWWGLTEGPVSLLIHRGSRVLRAIVVPQRPPAVVRWAWGLLTALQLGWTMLALVVLWQQPRDRRAVLLALVLLGTQWVFLPVSPRPVMLALALHLFLEFPTPLPFLPRRRLWVLYLPALVVGALTLGGARGRAGALLADAISVTYAAAGCWVAWRRMRAGTDGASARTLLVAATSLFAATVLAALEPRWVGSEWLLPLALVPAVVFALAIADLLFRRHALEVGFFLRRGAQYALARGVLVVLFTAPILLLAFRLGQLSTGASVAPTALAVYATWGVGVAVLGLFRTHLLAALDRHFFRDAYQAQQVLARLGADLAGHMDTGALVETVRVAIDDALHPEGVWIELREAPPAPGAPPALGAPQYWGEPGGRRGPGRTDPRPLTLPVRRGEQEFGWLAVGPRRSGLPYTVEDRQVLNTVAAQLAIALDNARLHAALLGRERRELALRARALLDGAEEERRRLAADLHDHVLPDLRHIAGEAERLRSLAEGPGDGLAAGLEGLEAATRAAMGGAREVMEALRPSSLDILGFSAALESTLRRSAARATPPLTAIFRREGPEPALTPDQSLALFRIGQEAINNAVTHAGATTLTLEMTTAERELHLRLADDGRGFCAEPALGRGIANMRHRAELIGATVAWQPQDGGGTLVAVRFPLEGNPHERD